MLETPTLGKEQWFMYNPFDENNTTNNAKDNEPLEQDTAKEEEPVNASQPETPPHPSTTTPAAR